MSKQAERFFSTVFKLAFAVAGMYLSSSSFKRTRSSSERSLRISLSLIDEFNEGHHRNQQIDSTSYNF